MTLTSSRPASAVATPAAGTASERPPTRSAGPFLVSLWLLVVLAATTVQVLDRLGPAVVPGVGVLPAYAAPAAAAAVTATFAAALAHRTGDRPVVALLVGLVLGGAATVLDVPVVDAGVALGTAVLAGVLAVMVTTPAAGFLRTLRETVLATAIASVGALAVAGYGPDVAALRFRYLAVVVALLVVLALVSGLGAGLHGAGRRGALALVLGTVILVAAVAYGEALSRWGSPAIIDVIVDLRGTLRTRIGAVPHPIETLLGFPALTWGVFMRARRRQGWWVCAFGVAATASTACALVDPSVGVLRAALGSAYSIVIGVLIGYLVIRLDLYWTGPRGARARRDEAAHAVRPEPGRTRALR